MADPLEQIAERITGHERDCELCGLISARRDAGIEADTRTECDDARLLRAALAALQSLARERDQAQGELQALMDYLRTLVCDDCDGTGRTSNHVTGEVECDACNGTGHDVWKAFQARLSVQEPREQENA
jgi:hypothetical protein